RTGNQGAKAAQTAPLQSRWRRERPSAETSNWPEKPAAALRSCDRRRRARAPPTQPWRTSQMCWSSETLQGISSLLAQVNRRGFWQVWQDRDKGWRTSLGIGSDAFMQRHFAATFAVIHAELPGWK